MSITGPKEQYTDVDSVTDLQNGTGKVAITWTPQVTGVHRVDVLYEEQPIKGNPFTVLVLPDPNSKVAVPSNCTAQGAGLNAPTEDRNTNFIIEARDQNGERIKQSGK